MLESGQMKIVNTSWGFIFRDAVLPVQRSPFRWAVRLGEEEVGPGSRRLAVGFVWFQVASSQTDTPQDFQPAPL